MCNKQVTCLTLVTRCSNFPFTEKFKEIIKKLWKDKILDNRSIAIETSIDKLDMVVQGIFMFPVFCRD